MRRSFTKEFKNEVLNLIKKGETRTSIAKKMNVGMSTICKWAERAGLKKNPTASYSLEFVQRVLSDVRNGMSVREAGQVHNVSMKTIYRWISEDNLDKRASKIIPEFTNPVKTPKKALEVILDNRLYADKQVQISLTDDNKLLFRIMSR